MRNIIKLKKLIKEQVIKAVVSIIISLIVISIVTLIPKDKEAEISLSLKLKSDFLVLDFISPSKNKQLISVEQVLSAERTTINNVILENFEVINICKLEKVNGQYLIKSILNKYTLSFNLLVDKTVDLDECVNEILNQVNFKASEWLKRIQKILLIKRDHQYTKLEDSLEEVTYLDPRVVMDVVKSINVRDIRNIQSDIKIVKSYLNEADYFNLINPNLSEGESPNIYIYFVTIFFSLIFLFNLKRIIILLKKY